MSFWVLSHLDNRPLSGQLFAILAMFSSLISLPPPPLSLNQPQVDSVYKSRCLWLCWMSVCPAPVTPKQRVMETSSQRGSSLKGWCTWHEIWLQMMILGPLSRVMMVRQPFCAKKNMQTSRFCVQNFYSRIYSQSMRLFGSFFFFFFFSYSFVGKFGSNPKYWSLKLGHGFSDCSNYL